MNYSQEEIQGYLDNMGFCEQTAAQKGMTLRQYLLQELRLDVRLADDLLTQWRPEPAVNAEESAEKPTVNVKELMLSVLEACAKGKKTKSIMAGLVEAGIPEQNAMEIVESAQAEIDLQKKAYKNTAKGQNQLIKTGLFYIVGGLVWVAVLSFIAAYYHVLFRRLAMIGALSVFIGIFKVFWHGIKRLTSSSEVTCPYCSTENQIEAVACAACARPLYHEIIMKAFFN
jgi:hypothetical protein